MNLNRLTTRPDEEMTRTLKARLRRARYVRLARFNLRRNSHFGGFDAFRRRVREAKQVKEGMGVPGPSVASPTRFELASPGEDRRARTIR